jgi:peptidoglycan hydrolase-like protein with peptidoglycan-binding domain
MASAATLDDFEGDIDTQAESECLVLTKDLRLRSRDAKTEGEVSLLQDFLNTRGYLRTEPTGYFSVSTFAAVKAFQKEMKLRPTGFVSVLTRKAIEKVSCDGTTTQTVTVTLKSNVTSYQEGDTIIFTAKVTEQDGTPLTPQEGATITIHQLSADAGIDDKDTMSFDRRSSTYVLRSDDHTTSDDAGSWTAFATVSKNGSHAGTSEKIAYRVIADEPYVSCTDSDGGKDYFSKGETEGISPSTGQQYSGSDVCGTGTTYAVGQLVEHYCDGKYHTNTVYTCPYGCTNGACLRFSDEHPMRVITPNGFEQWPEGNQYELRWTPTGKQVPTVQFVDVTVVDTNGSTVATIAGGLSNSGRTYWVPSGLYGNGIYGKLKLKVCQTGTSNCDMSDNYFTITKVSKNLPPVVDSVSAPTTLSAGETGKWFVYAHDPERRQLTYSVDWGDGAKDSSSVSRAYEYSTSVQTTTFTHAYVFAGTYTPKFFVKDDAGQVESASATVVVRGMTAPDYDACRLDQLNGANITKQAILDRDSCLRNLCDIYGPTNLGQMSSKCMFLGQEIKRYTQQPHSVSVLSPNGGDIWEIGSTYTVSYEIRMLSSKFMPGARIYLEKEYEPGSYKKGINSSMLIGTTSDPGQYTYTVPAIIQQWPGLGSNYRIKVCSDSHGQICDSSDRTFTIRTTPPVTNLPPVIDGLTAPTTVTAGQSGQWTVRAHDPENKQLTYAVAWGDEPLATQKNGIVMAAPGSLFVQTTIFTHTYSTPGTYMPKFFVKDDAGQVQTTGASVIVGAIIPPAVYEANLRMGKNEYPFGENVQLFAKVTHAPGDIFTPSEGAEVTAMLTDQNGRSYGNRLLKYNSVSGDYEWKEGLGAGKWVYVVTVTKHGVTVLKDSMTGFSVVAPLKNLPPVVDSVVTPVSVSAEITAQWTIKAHDPENKPLTYAVVWGDEPKALAMESNAPGVPFVQTTTFTHTYQSAGDYTIRFFVKDDAGQVTPTNVSFAVLPYVACRLDQLNGANITQSTVNVDRQSCLTKLCDVYGPANLGQMSSMCVFMGKEIKRYEKAAPKPASATLIGTQSTYTADQPIKFSVRAITSAGLPGTPEKGFNVVAVMRFQANPDINNYVSQTPAAVFNPTTGNWDVTLTAPSDPTKTYRNDILFYCYNPEKGCATGQISSSYTFTIPQPLPKAASAELLDVQSTYIAGQPVKINMRGMTMEGVVGAPDKGFNVQARLKSTAVPGTVQVDGEHQAVNATFDPSSGNWVIILKTPPDTAPTYTVDAAFYCSTPGRGCADNQINRTATFMLTPPVMVPTSSN